MKDAQSYNVQISQQYTAGKKSIKTELEVGSYINCKGNTHHQTRLLPLLKVHPIILYWKLHLYKKTQQKKKEPILMAAVFLSSRKLPWKLFNTAATLIRQIKKIGKSTWKQLLHYNLPLCICFVADTVAAKTNGLGSWKLFENTTLLLKTLNKCTNIQNPEIIKAARH